MEILEHYSDLTKFPQMEAPEVPTDEVREHIDHHAHESKESWISWVALSTAILAACAAVASLSAGHHANEAMFDQIKSTDDWSFFEAKGNKSYNVQNALLTIDGLKVLYAKDPAKLKELEEKEAKYSEKIKEFDKEKEEIKAKAKEENESAEKHLEAHNSLAGSVTLFQIAIAIGAIAVLTKRRRFWFVSLAFGFTGIFFLIQRFIH